MSLFIRLALVSLVVLSVVIIADEHTKGDKESSSKTLKKSHKEMSHDEKFPGDYFLIHKNLPHYMHIFANYENDTNLALNTTQKKELQKLREKVVIQVSELALKIKELEIKVQKQVVFEHKSSSDLEKQVREIAKLRADLTLAHIDCIEGVKKIITKEQHKFFLEKLGIQ